MHSTAQSLKVAVTSQNVPMENKSKIVRRPRRPLRLAQVTSSVGQMPYDTWGGPIGTASGIPLMLTPQDVLVANVENFLVSEEGSGPRKLPRGRRRWLPCTSGVNYNRKQYSPNGVL